MSFVVASSALCELLHGPPRPARAVAVLPAAVYLEAGPDWVALLARDAVRVPIGLVTASPEHQRPFGRVAVGAGAVVGGGALRVDGDAEYRPLRYWDPAVPRLCGALATAPVTRRVEALAQLAAGLPAVDAAGWPERAARLEVALAPPAPAPEPVADAVRGLVGLGPGLTPAGDDVVAGALATLAAAADGPRHRALVAAVEPLLAATTPVSAALLRSACHGRAAPQVSAVLRALAGSGDLDVALGRLARVGHTSGAALAAGMRAALRARATRTARAGRRLRRCA